MPPWSAGPAGTRPLRRAIEIAAQAHAGQLDKAGAPYILHPLRVMLHVDSPPEQVAAARIVAVFHDVVEDSSWTLEELRAEGVSEEVVRAVEALTHRPSEVYLDFVRRAGADPVARAVKVADLRDNIDLSRFAVPTERDRSRLERYRRALAILEASATGS